MKAELKKILIIKPSSLGDIIQALPVLPALHRNFPDSNIVWLVRKEFAPLIENHPHLSNVVLFDRKFLGQAWYDLQAFRALVSLIEKLRKKKFDLVIDLQGLFRTASLSLLSGCKRRFGMRNSREFSRIFYTKSVTQDATCIHLVDYYMKIIKAAGVKDLKVEFQLPVEPNALDSVNSLLTERAVQSDNYAVFVPGSAHKDKCWPSKNFATLAEKISSDFGFSIVATGTASEAAIVEHINSRTAVPIINLAGQTDIKQLVALLSKAKVVISNDTGPGHIAAALGVPVVLIFGRSNPARVAPYGRDNCVAAVEPNSRGFKADSNDLRHSINNVTVDEVYQKACKQLQ